MGTLIIGRQGTGKTSSLSRHIVDYFTTHPEEAIFVLDWSGSITDTILTLILQLPQTTREGALKRLIYDELGHREWVIPFPEFSHLYGDPEEQVQRVATNLGKLEPYLVQQTPVIGGLAIKNSPNFFRVCTAVTNELGENWQITEVKRLIVDEPLLRRCLKEFGQRIPDAKYYLENIYLTKKSQDKYFDTHAILSILNAVEPREVRARVGYYRPGWTPREAIENGMMVIVNGANMINQRNAQHYLFTQAYSLIMAEINKRAPGNPEDRPVSLVMDEVYSLIGIPGMAEEIGMISPLYRSRKLQLYIVLQSLSQLAKPLDEQIWSLGNKMVFAMENKDEAEKVAHQLFKYDPRYTKQPARTLQQNPITEPEHGQDRIIADWIQNLGFREALMRRFISERQLDPFVRHISKTRDHPSHPPAEPVSALKERLMRERGVQVRDALEVINRRELTREDRRPPTI
jgi:hypothetical protein